jgi:hypothetical protein
MGLKDAAYLFFWVSIALLQLALCFKQVWKPK